MIPPTEVILFIHLVHSPFGTTVYSLQVMGQQEISTSDNTTIKVTQLPKLAADGENWLTYHEWVLNAATARGLCRHRVGTVLKPSPVVEKDGKFYLSVDDVLPLDEETLDKHESSVDTWEQKEARSTT